MRADTYEALVRIDGIENIEFSRNFHRFAFALQRRGRVKVIKQCREAVIFVLFGSPLLDEVIQLRKQQILGGRVFGPTARSCMFIFSCLEILRSLSAAGPRPTPTPTRR